MSILRITLGFVGVIGLALWLMLSALVWLFQGFKPGGPQGGLSVGQAWLCALAPMAAFSYYSCVAAFEWSRRLFVAGLAVHLLLFVAAVTLASFTDGGFLALPILLVGPALWIPYAIRIQKSDHTA